MEATKRRIRLYFQDRGILSKTQKKNGLKRSWVFLKPHHITISDVVAHIIHYFDLHDSCPHGLILSMDGFVLPPFESTTIFKDKDLISVKRKGSGMCDSRKAIEDAMPSIEDEIIEKQPLPSGVMLLANEEFDKETGGYQSKIAEDEDEAEELLQSAQCVNVAAKKRKAASPIEILKKKRQRQETPKSVREKDGDHCEHIKPQQKKKKLSKASKDEVIVNCIKTSEPKSKSNELEEKREETINASSVPDKAKKVSRSTLRKRLQRKWSKLAKSDVENGEKQLRAKDLCKDSGSRKDADTNIEQLIEEDSGADDDLVPVEIRPGHIRFTPAGKAAKDVQKNKEDGWDAQKNQETNGCASQKYQGVSGWDVKSPRKKAWEDHTAQKNAWDVNKNKVTKESFCWNGITNKRKGQKWGKENQATSWKESRDYNGHSSSSRAFKNQQSSTWNQPKDHNTCSSSTWASRGKQPRDVSVDFEKLMPLTDFPKVGDIIAYRLLELSSSWCPELSSFRVGKITSFDQDSKKIILVPESKYPLNFKWKADVVDDDEDDDSGQPPQPSVYKEDGSLEIDFPSLVDVCIVKDPSQSEGVEIPAINGLSPSGMSISSDKTDDGSKKGASDTGIQELHTPATPGTANGKKDVWEEISEALSAKKSQLMQEDSWNKKENSAKRSWSHRTLKSSALGPTMAMLRAQNDV